MYIVFQFRERERAPRRGSPSLRYQGGRLEAALKLRTVKGYRQPSVLARKYLGYLPLVADRRRRRRRDGGAPTERRPWVEIRDSLIQKRRVCHRGVPAEEKKTPLIFECFPYVCPEPVLVKRCILGVKWHRRDSIEI